MIHSVAYGDMRPCSSSIAVLQPSYIPWPGYFNQICRVNYFVFYDDVQYDKNGWRNRNRVLLNNNLLWLTVPVYQKNKFGQILNNVRIDHKSNWICKHLNTIKHAYSKHPYFDDFYPLLEQILLEKVDFLSDLNIKLIMAICDFLEIDTKFFKSSELGVNGDRNSRLVAICKKLNCSVYLSGNSAINYIDIDYFNQNHISVVWQNFSHTRYPKEEIFMGEYISVIGLIFRYGKKSINFIRQ